MGFLFSEEHQKITDAETNLTKMMSEFEHRCDDKRTSEYKRIEPMLDETRKYIQSVEHKGLSMIAAMRETKITANKYYRKEHEKEILEIFRMVKIKKTDYLKFLAKVSLQIHNEYCDCDRLDYIGDHI